MTGAVPPAPAARLIVEPFGAEAVVFDPEHRTVHRLNETAFAIWSACDGTTTTGEIARRLAGTFDLESTTILGDIEAGVADLLAGGAIGTADPSTDPQQVVEQWRLQDLAPLSTDELAELARRDWPYRIGPLAAFDCRFDVVTDHGAVAAALETFLAPLTAPDHDSQGPSDRGPDGLDHVLRVADLSNTDLTSTDLTSTGRAPSDRAPIEKVGFEITIDDRRMGTHSHGPAAARQLLWLVNRLATSSSPRRPTLHAAAAQREGATVLLPAESNGGKSTLVAALVRRGYDYLSDEAVGIDREPLLVHPYPKAISLDQGSFTVLAELEPDLGGDLAPYSERTWQVPPTSIRADVTCTSGDLAVVVFPTYTQDSPTVVDTMTPIDTFDRLLHLSFELCPDPRTAVGTLRRVADEIPSYRMTSGDLAEACTTVDDLLLSTDT